MTTTTTTSSSAMCRDCEAFSLCRYSANLRNLWQITYASPLRTAGMPPTYRTHSVDSAHLFTCYNCSAVKDSLWIVSYVVDVSAIDECLCCVECLIRNFKDPAFSREHKISLRCGGEGCSLKLDTWTKAPELVISLLKEHTKQCPSRPVFCVQGCKSIIRRQDQSLHESSCVFRSTPEEKEALKMQEVENRLFVSPAKMRYQKMADVPLKRRDSWNNINPAASDPSHEALRQNVLNVSRRSSAALPTAADDVDSVDSVGKNISPKSLSLNRSRSQPGTSSRANGRLSDETLEQLEKARIALERQGLDVANGTSSLPEVFAQKMNADDLPTRDRIEKLEEVVATTRAQLEKAFVEIRNLRALLASENKLRELHVAKLRDEFDLFKSYVRFDGQ